MQEGILELVYRAARNGATVPTAPHLPDEVYLSAMCASCPESCSESWMSALFGRMQWNQ